MDRNTPVFIVGYMGAGKSTLGRKLALLMEREFIDTDLFIENRFRKSVSDIFAQEGEAIFRSREKFVIEELSSFPNAVIATGGGLPCYYDNMALMKSSGVTIYLQLSAPVLAERIELCKRTRPTVRHLSGEALLQHISAALEERVAYYEQAELIISCDEVKSDQDEALLAQDIASRLSLL
ncbi:shikimate kinase [Porphyromonas circumdentaria]|uniref:Shikimate kinase n=1 Tax=Porphyromonas circumdentaria TaxID=29524 RepID=A0A1T4L108_9PORP|nr:shikimate kinase [Porphyromonas circumdentaria]MBB6275173.1 shikimate kinase [Porphyromonas circumdentaria]MDO4721803.1 shikimate kinase [Porphyromonas circumdentaria]SJZ48281.1 shikimate kinase [Porphyromonas circumdentaria]